MRKFNLALLLIVGAIQMMFAQSSQKYDESVGGEKQILNAQIKTIERFSNDETKGKLVKDFMKVYPPNSSKETIYLGPFNPTLISGKQDFYTCYHYDAMTKAIMGVPRGFYYKVLSDYFNKIATSITILGYSKPSYMYENVAEYTFNGMTDEQKIQAKYQIVKANKDRTTINGTRPDPDIYYWILHLFYLPTEEYKIEQKRLYDLGLQEAQNLTIQNFEDARYYNYYYGKDNANKYQYNENLITAGYGKMSNIEEKVAYLNLFNYSSSAKTMQNEILKTSNDFDILLYAYRAIRSNDIAAEMEKKLANLANELYQIRTYMETFPNSSYLTQLDDKAYSLCSVSSRDPYSYVALFPTGKHIKEANETIEKIKEEIRIAQEKIRQERIAKIANEGPNGVYRSNSFKTFGLSWGRYTVYNIEFNDSTTGAFYQQRDGRYCLETGLFGTEAVYYASEKDAANALYVFRKTNSFTSQGRTGDSRSEFIANQNRANLMPVPNYQIKGWKGDEYSMESEVLVDGEIIGTIGYKPKSGEYYIWGLILNTYYDSEANIVRALYANKKLGVLSTVGQK